MSKRAKNCILCGSFISLTQSREICSSCYAREDLEGGEEEEDFDDDNDDDNGTGLGAFNNNKTTSSSTRAARWCISCGDSIHLNISGNSVRCKSCFSASDDRRWSCKMCTFANLPESKTCEICEASKLTSSSSSSSSSSSFSPPPSLQSNEWTCQICTLTNDLAAEKCLACGTRPSQSSSKISDYSESPSEVNRIGEMNFDKNLKFISSRTNVTSNNDLSNNGKRAQSSGSNIVGSGSNRSHNGTNNERNINSSSGTSGSSSKPPISSRSSPAVIDLIDDDDDDDVPYVLQTSHSKTKFNSNSSTTRSYEKGNNVDEQKNYRLASPHNSSISSGIALSKKQNTAAVMPKTGTSNSNSSSSTGNIYSSSQASSTPNSKVSQVNSINNTNNTPDCKCGLQAKQIKVKKEGDSKGKFFFACPRSLDDTSKCKFFQWANNNNDGTNSVTSSSTSSSSSSSSQKKSAIAKYIPTNIINSCAINRNISLKLLSYNVWFSNISQEIRMRGIGTIVEREDPDLITFQEVTAPLYALLFTQSWFCKYHCSVPDLQSARMRGDYFVMLLVKRMHIPTKTTSPPATSSPYTSSRPIPNPFYSVNFQSHKFPNSIMGRELVYISLPSLGIIVATSHLESPTPSPPKWNQMNEEERRNQLKLSVEVLNRESTRLGFDVLFAGDFNWSESRPSNQPSDGSMDLPDDWVDCWLLHKENSNGLSNTIAAPGSISSSSLKVGSDDKGDEDRGGWREDVEDDEDDKEGKSSKKKRRKTTASVGSDLKRLENKHIDGFTYNGSLNAMIGGSLKGRLDRCLARLLRDPNSHTGSMDRRLRLEDVRIVGDEAIPGAFYNKEPSANAVGGKTKTLPVLPSDHFGMVVSFEVNR